MTYYNTTNVKQPELGLYQASAKSQTEMILDFFKSRPGIWYTPFEILAMLKAKTGKNIPVTSVRRSITNLCKSGELLKSDKATMKGIYNHRNYCWTFNRVA